MESRKIKPPLYVEHAGTIRVSGMTSPRSAGFCAFVFLQKGIFPIDFFYIGGNAGQQAMKSMSIFAFIVQKDLPGMLIAFRPIRFMTTADEKEKDATVWRTVLVTEIAEDFTSKEVPK
jgi:hypothetical protein